MKPAWAGKRGQGAVGEGGPHLSTQSPHNSLGVSPNQEIEKWGGSLRKT